VAAKHHIAEKPEGKITMGIRQYRLSKIRISTGLGDSILRGQFGGIASNQVPDDLQVVGVEQPDHSIGTYFYFIVHSKEFPAIRASEPIPELPAIEFSPNL
jgi:hypothetical protein